MNTLQKLRISMEQRQAMLQFMEQHPELAKGKFSGPNGARLKSTLWEELTNILNSLPSGCTKSSDKWMKSWQDWRCDIKRKAARIHREKQKTGGGPPPGDLLHIEEKLVSLMGKEAVEGLLVPDPLELDSMDCAAMDQIQKLENIASDVHILKPTPSSHTSIPSTSATIFPSLLQLPVQSPSSPHSSSVETPKMSNTQVRKRKRKQIEDSEDRLTVAMEEQAISLNRIADAFERLADVAVAALEIFTQK